MLESLNFLDIILILIFLISIIIGFGRGFIAEFLAFATLIVAFIIAINFSIPLADQLITVPTVQNAVQQTGASSSPTVQQSASYLAIAFSFTVLFIGTLVLGAIIRFVLNLALVQSFGFFNRFLGGLFGAARGYLYNLFLIFVMTLTPFSSQHWWQQSSIVKLYQPQVFWLANQVSPSLESLKSQVTKKAQKVSYQIQTFMKSLAT